MTTALRLGKCPARLGAVKLRMSNYVDVKGIAKRLKITERSRVGHDKLVTNWGMLANDRLGDCVIAGIYHALMLWNAMNGGGSSIKVTDERVVKTYSELTGYNGTEATDNGTDMVEAAKHLRDHGFVDDNGISHKIAAFVGLHPGDWLQHQVAIRLFGCAAVGIRFPNSAWTQFEKRQTWTPVPRTGFDGGHYILATSTASRLMKCVTWGRLQPLDQKFLAEYEDEGQAYLSWEMLNPEGKTIDGYDREGLLKDLATFTGRTVDQVVADARDAIPGPQTMLA